MNIVCLFLPRHTRRLVSTAILDSVKLTIVAITRVACLAVVVKLGEDWDFKRVTDDEEGVRRQLVWGIEGWSWGVQVGG